MGALPAHLDPILLAFERNARVNAALLAGLADEDLGFAAGGWSIGKHLCHLASFRRGWLGIISPERARGLIASVGQAGEGDFEPLLSHVDDISDAFREGDAAALDVVSRALAEGVAFGQVYRSHPTGFLIHILIHDAHHRGQIMSLLRQSGRTKGEMESLEDAGWAIWRE